MPTARNRTKIRALAGLTAFALSGVALLGLGVTPASAATGAQVVSIANANLGKGYCSTNSAGGTGFASSCTGNNGTGEYWCGDFVSWVWQQAGIPVPASNPASVPSWVSTPGYHTIDSGYIPQPGDAVVFGDDKYPSAGSHIALVTSYSNGLLSDIGGDEGGGGSPWWSTSSVKTDEGNGAAWNPSNKLFAGQSYEMWVIGYVSAGAATTGGSIPAGFNVGIDANGAAVASGQAVSGAVNLTAMASSQKVINSLTYKITGPNGTQTIDGGTGADNYAKTWNTSTLPGGTYTISVTANEIDGQNHTYGPVTVTVDNGATSDSSWSVYNPDTKSMTLFGLGSGGHLGLTKSTDGGASWSNWTEANAYWALQGTPSTVYDPDAKMTMLFARGASDGAMGISTSTNDGAGWSNWAPVNAFWSNFKGDASAVYNPDTKKVTVFARGGDGRIGYTQSGNAGASWSNWAEVNAYWNNFAGDPHVIYNPVTKRMTVFARGGDGRIGYTQSTNDGASWSNWAEVNAYWNNFTGDPHPVYNASTKSISLLARGGDGRIGYTQSTNDGASWSNWAEANAYWNNFTGDPTAIYDPNTNRNTAFALGSGGHMGYTQSNASGWSNWGEVNAYWTLIGS
ncbi:hypothetical protein [Streptomyces sp. NPDC054783]